MSRSSTKQLPNRRHWRWSRLVAALALFLLGSIGLKYAAATSPAYYVSCTTGSDYNTGATSATPWKSLSKVGRTTFSAGSTIYLRSGCSFDGGLRLNGGGTSGLPITVTSYGAGARPVVSYSSGSLYSDAIVISGAYVTVQNLKIIKGSNSGIGIDGPHATIRNNEMTNDGQGVEIRGGGTSAYVANNYVHDLKMVVNARGGDDDYGAICFTVQATNVEIVHNRGTNCVAPSYDYGTDGGFVEVWEGADNLYVHDNYSNNTDGFLEAGADSNGSSANNMRFVNNIIVNAGALINIHTDGHFAIPVSNLQFLNNTTYQSAKTTYDMFYSPDSVTARNNIFYMGTNTGLTVGTAPHVHTNNLYYCAWSDAGISLGAGEKMADPKFVAPGTDFHLQASSPARGMALALPGIEADYAGRAMGTSPDAGAYPLATP